MEEQISILDEASISQIVHRALEAHLADSEDESDPYLLFHSRRAQELKQEIVAAGKKLWQRQYVDGNGGNISARISPQYVVCTPTMLSKGDLRPEDLSLVDLDNKQIVGNRPQTSEVSLHLEIYKAVPQAQAVVHCHPPYATAHAVAGILPQGNLIPEQEVFIGPVALAPYETPGTAEFARSVLPMAKHHNTIFLTNHGIVCWSDTVTHAEWNAEIIDTYCKTAMIAAQLKSPLPEIPPGKIDEILAIKRYLGFPDARLAEERELPQAKGNLVRNPSGAFYRPVTGPRRLKSREELERLVEMVTAELVNLLDSRD
ncbi:MAG TPA: class II aldolase/adducin family protein [Terracidiphilus sp.]|nr:class II aldolase/adducin family protein [Terracidiphilus sp.]